MAVVMMGSRGAIDLGRRGRSWRRSWRRTGSLDCGKCRIPRVRANRNQERGERSEATRSQSWWGIVRRKQAGEQEGGEQRRGRQAKEQGGGRKGGGGDWEGDSPGGGQQSCHNRAWAATWRVTACCGAIARFESRGRRNPVSMQAPTGDPRAAGGGGCARTPDWGSIPGSATRPRPSHCGLQKITSNHRNGQQARAHHNRPKEELPLDEAAPGDPCKRATAPPPPRQSGAICCAFLHSEHFGSDAGTSLWRFDRDLVTCLGPSNPCLLVKAVGS